MTDFEQKRRAAFEEWFWGKFPEWAKEVLTLNEHGLYEDFDTQLQWESWQAALEWVNKGERE